jgi:hypothetical protein
MIMRRPSTTARIKDIITYLGKRWARWCNASSDRAAAALMHVIRYIYEAGR